MAGEFDSTFFVLTTILAEAKTDDITSLLCTIYSFFASEIIWDDFCGNFIDALHIVIFQKRIVRTIFKLNFRQPVIKIKILSYTCTPYLNFDFF